MRNRGLSKHFSEKTFAYSDVAVAYKIDNSFETEIVFKNATSFCREILEAIYAHYGIVPTLSSGYRCTKLNSHKKIGGAANSAHRFGNAGDTNVNTIGAKRLFNDIISGRIKQSNGRPLYEIIDQCIYEEKKGMLPWCHLGRAGKPRREFMTRLLGKGYVTVTKEIK